MSRKKYIALLYFMIIPFVLISQNINIPALYSFSELEKGNYQNALDTLDKLIAENPKADYYLARAEAFLKTEEYNKALINCDLADKIKPHISSELKFRIILDNDDLSRAGGELTQNLNSSYKISMYSLLEDASYNKLKGSDLLNDILQSNNYSKTEKQLYQVERLMNSGENNQAYFLVNEILSRNNKIAYAYFLLSKINQNSDDEKGSLEAINKAIELKKSDATYYEQRIMLLKDKQDYAQALKDAEKLIRLKPYLIENYILKADLLFLNGNYEEAIRLIGKIKGISENYPDLLYLQSKAYFEKENYLEALKSINQSMQYKQTKEQYELRGDIYLATNTWDFAIRDYSMFLDIEPFSGDIYAKKGLVRYKSGDRAGACSDWKKGTRYGSYDAGNYMTKYCE